MWELPPKSSARCRNSALCSLCRTGQLLRENENGQQVFVKGGERKEEKAGWGGGECRITPASKSVSSDTQDRAHLTPTCQRSPQPTASPATSEFSGLTAEKLNGKCKLPSSAFPAGAKHSAPREDEAPSQGSAIIWGEKKSVSALASEK